MPPAMAEMNRFPVRKGEKTNPKGAKRALSPRARMMAGSPRTMPATANHGRIVTSASFTSLGSAGAFLIRYSTKYVSTVSKKGKGCFIRVNKSNAKKIINILQKETMP